MKRKRVLPPTTQQRRDHQQRIGCGVPWTDLAVLFAMPRQAAQVRAVEAQAGTAIGRRLTGSAARGRRERVRLAGLGPDRTAVRFPAIRRNEKSNSLAFRQSPSFTLRGAISANQI